MSTAIMLFACFQICASNTMPTRKKRLWIAAFFALTLVLSNVVIVYDAPAGESAQEYSY